jgi:hypothetical protein
MSAPAVAVLLAGPFDAELVDGRPVRELALGALAGLALLSDDQVSGDVILVIHDPACPNVPASFVRELIEACGATGRSQMAVLAVTDTIKVTDGPTVGETLDRDTLAVLASPLVLPPGVRPRGRDMAGLLDDLCSRGGVDLVEAPPEVVRLMDASDTAFLPPGGSPTGSSGGPAR